MDKGRSAAVGALQKLRKGVERRLQFIDFRLFWEGKINRGDLVERFKISVPQASKDLSLYESLATGNMEYDSSGKRYMATRTFAPRFFEPAADEYLTQLRNVTDHTSDQSDTWLGTLPSADSMPIPQRRVEVDALRTILNAIKSHEAVRILYQSMNAERPGPTWRWVSPHALAHDGLRWHLRGFCEETDQFKDFVLSRCLETKETRPTSVKPEADRFWNEYFSVILVPNPAFSTAQREVIAQDYRMEYGQTAVAVRKALLYYFNKRLRLDVAKAIDDPKETPVVVLNETPFRQALMEVG